MSFNEQEGTCNCTLRRSSITQDIAREVSTTTAYSIGFVVVRSLQLKWWAMRTMRRVKGGVGYHYA
ncbi:hypothetical protein TIFTF001_021842 [Ficus carica]|uniref:Uncharacterized protein n=1 Tax=Ficus carica TaxID=3494 RepID=A0AA88ADG6_FICCA|nr:hypothetical protein TIFTF001_021842 [Ficus carica]